MNERNTLSSTRADHWFALSAVSRPIAVSTADAAVRSEELPLEQRLAAVRAAAKIASEGSCGGVGGGWGN